MKDLTTLDLQKYIAEKRKAARERWDRTLDMERRQWELKSARLKATEGLTIEELRRVTPDLIRQFILSKGSQ